MSNKPLAKKIFMDALDASLPKNFISDHCRLDGDILSIENDSYNLSRYKNIYVFGSGKAAATMALEIEKLLNKRIFKGLVVSSKTDVKLNYVEVCEGSHPLPEKKSLDSTTKLLEMMRECDEEDLYIYLLSGGSSALIELPIEPISLEDLQETTELMLHNALDIHEMNVVRKHLSQIKGGKLAQECKAQGIVLVLSDIIDNDLYSIGSAPLYADKSTYTQAKEILESKDLFYSLPDSVQEVIERGISSLLDETPKQEKECVKHYVLASNSLALHAAAKSARSNGLGVKVVDEGMQGDVNEMVHFILECVKNSQEKCLIFGGECTVKVAGDGKGGRNQHAVALMLQELDKEGISLTFLSAGTDGIDGNSDAAGGVIDSDDTQSIDKRKLKEHIEGFNSYNLLKEMESLIVTGPSGTNVIDLAIAIKGE
ncbi:MAG: DUF4147 domain-containing protein [Campylobacterota bacterium]|nr:DUF4147 domain-containing protein [Campylobacterota bacterium]